MTRPAIVLVGLATAGTFLMCCREGRSQVPAGEIQVELEVPSDARVYFNGQLIPATGHVRRYSRSEMTPGQEYGYRLNVEIERSRQVLRYEQGLVLRAGELRRIGLPESSFAAKPKTPRDVRAELPPRPASLLLLTPPMPQVRAPERAKYLAASDSDLKLTAEMLDEARSAIGKAGRLGPCLWPAVVLEGEGEAYADLASGEQPILVVRTDQPRDVSGVLLLPGRKQVVRVPFTLRSADASQPQALGRFYQKKANHYAALVNAALPGAAWFRYQMREANAVFYGEEFVRQQDHRLPPARPQTNLMNWSDLLTGGRAISENLWLDRPMYATNSDRPAVMLSAVPGIRVQPFDWGPLVQGLKPKLDPLAAAIPDDQHAVFFPSAEAAVRLARHASGGETLVLRLAEPRSEQSRIQERYERQFCLSLERLAEILKPEVATTVALTGSDPYVSMGTDVALLIESPDPNALAAALAAEMTSTANRLGPAEAAQAEINGVRYQGVSSPDRRISSYVAVLGPRVVVVTNSLAQLKRLAEVRDQRRQSLMHLPEYTWFRSRYLLGDPKEAALVVMSDATIRRWCGPRWRIGQARRTWNAAVLSDAQAMAADTILQGRAAGAKPTQPQLPDDLRLGRHGVYSVKHGSLEFLTPILDLSADWASQEEVNAYNQWRMMYEQQWQRFDPIALRLELDPQRLAADLTITPLTLRTQYAYVRSLVQGAGIPPAAGDPHDALLQVYFALNKNSEPVLMARQFATFAVQSGKDLVGDVLDWFAGTASIWLDDSPSLKERLKQLNAERPSGMKPERSMPIALQLPVGVQIEATSGLKLTKFLLGLRTFIELTAPGMFKWELRTYREQSYAKVSLSEKARQQIPDSDADLARQAEQVALYYTTSGDALVMGLREEVLQHALDRRMAARGAKSDGKLPPPRDDAWTGRQLGVHADAKLLNLLSDLLGDDLQAKMQELAWSNLPALNEWKRRYPGPDPLAVHERLWQARLVCPGGGSYVWDPAWQTYASTAYGHPAAPKQGPAVPPLLQGVQSADFGLGFEHEGLRARISIARATERVGKDGGQPKQMVTVYRPNGMQRQSLEPEKVMRVKLRTDQGDFKVIPLLSVGVDIVNLGGRSKSAKKGVRTAAFDCLPGSVVFLGKGPGGHLLLQPEDDGKTLSLRADGQILYKNDCPCWIDFDKESSGNRPKGKATAATRAAEAAEKEELARCLRAIELAKQHGRTSGLLVRVRCNDAGIPLLAALRNSGAGIFIALQPREKDQSPASKELIQAIADVQPRQLALDGKLFAELKDRIPKVESLYLGLDIEEKLPDLSSLPNLRHLWLIVGARDKVKAAFDLRGLENTKHLKALTLFIDDDAKRPPLITYPVQGLEEVQFLCLMTELPELPSMLNNMHGLRHLAAGFPKNTDFSFTNRMPYLQTLVMNGEQQNLKPLESLRSLRCLALAGSNPSRAKPGKDAGFHNVTEFVEARPDVEVVEYEGACLGSFWLVPIAGLAALLAWRIRQRHNAARAVV